MKLYLVRGHDVEGEDQDWFVVASSPERAIDLWNDAVLFEGLPREYGDDVELPRTKTVKPQNIREILNDVAGTQYEGVERPVSWDELTVVA